MFRNNQSIYCKNEKIAAQVRAYAKKLNAEDNLASTSSTPIAEPESTKPQKNELGIYDVHKNMSLPMLSSWEQYQQYPWVFEQARNALVRDFDGQQVTMEVIAEYVERRLKLID